MSLDLCVGLISDTPFCQVPCNTISWNHCQVSPWLYTMLHFREIIEEQNTQSNSERNGGRSWGGVRRTWLKFGKWHTRSLLLWRLLKKSNMVFDPDSDVIFVFNAGCWFAMLSPPESPSILTASNLMSTSCPQCWRSSHTPHTPTHSPHLHPSLFTAAWVGLPFWFHVPEAGWALLSSHIQRHLAFERIIPPSPCQRILHLFIQSQLCSR